MVHKLGATVKLQSINHKINRGILQLQKEWHRPKKTRTILMKLIKLGHHQNLKIHHLNLKMNRDRKDQIQMITSKETIKKKKSN